MTKQPTRQETDNPGLEGNLPARGNADRPAIGALGGNTPDMPGDISRPPQDRPEVNIDQPDETDRDYLKP
jgi:hypothetical protein